MELAAHGTTHSAALSLQDYPPATTPARCMPRTAVPAPSPMCRDRRPPGTIAAPASCRWKAEYTEWPAIWAGARKTPPMMLCPRRSRRNLAMAWVCACV
ncbi:hypothetical protein F751_6810 [Auxenochlorella protothecoides]|uniref:Uncharacterized protein n=1 Tax=Auxenochlorella protothecoides TaxID=3075 RepID=A0A087SDN8_AUXPR|nr:hypothetical protein F751_6810 [Auxenochlorella protothecoides]KFM23842.1 hypothetical protein F751_6810 [Auxenochlorella protothecoides]